MKVIFAIFILLLTLYIMNEFQNTKSEGIENERSQKELDDSIYTPKASLQALVGNEVIQFQGTNFVQTWTADNVNFQYNVAAQLVALNVSTVYNQIATKLKGRQILRIDIECILTYNSGVNLPVFVDNITLSDSSSPVPDGIDLPGMLPNLTSLGALLRVKFDRSVTVIATNTSNYNTNFTMIIRYK
jgi:hypothetical protein